MPHAPRIPDLPGDLVPQEYAEDLRRSVAQLCELNSTRFPGSQPVSFAQKDLTRLENEDYWVCEKSDGVRVLFFVHTLDAETQMVYIIDRHNTYRHLTGFFFPHHEDPRLPLSSTITDGELVIDTDPRTKLDILRLLTFDCLVVDGQNVMSRPLDKRYGRLQEWFYKPYKKMMQDHPFMMQNQPFEIQIKGMNLSYGLEKVFNEDIPKLQHGNDGLIYTCLHSPYVVGTDQNILKWKSPSDNTIDFKLVLRFPPLSDNPKVPDYCARPIFALHTYAGGKGSYEPFDELYVEDDEWERFKVSGEQVDDRIVEVFWEKNERRWRLMRFRDDKPHGNHKSVIDSIIQSILDGVEKEDLLVRSNLIRAAWKARQAQQQRQDGPSQSQVPAKGAPLAQRPMPTHGHGPAQHHVRSDSTVLASTETGREHGENHMGGDSNFVLAGGVPSSATTTSAVAASTRVVDLRYGPLQESPFSRVGGPTTVFGFNR